VSTAVNVLVASDGLATVSAPMPVAAISGDKALVLLTPWAKNEMREIDLSRMTVKLRTDVQSAGLFSIPPSTMASSADGTVALLGGETPGYPTTYFAWKYDAASDSFSAPVTFSYDTDSAAVNSNGTVLSLGAYALDQNLMPLVPIQTAGQNNAITGSGALLYGAGSEVLISDTHNGRPFLSLPPLLDSEARALAVDPTGQKILVCAGTSLHYYELAVVPLAAASVSPAQAAVGASLTIHGNGFVAGTKVVIAKQSAKCSMVNSQTLRCSVPDVRPGLAPMTLSNPDGQSYTLEAAFRVE
jgi:hypothetical protein